MVKPAAIKNSGPDLDDGRLPVHIAVIMDGNGRWARKRSLPRVAGHRKGAESARNLITLCGNRKISFLTLFAFSSENWKRPQPEVNRLMDIFISALDKDVKKLHESNVRFRVIGERSSLSSGIVEKIEKGETLTAANTGLQLNVAMNYGGKWDVVTACQRVADQVASGARKPGSITFKDLEKGLSTAGQPEPDLFIRTGGEHRISNFLLWQLAYTELYFSDILWPDFGEEDFDQALNVYASRQRRFGQTGDQVGAG
ncbi:MAG: polyprenyl diphosphate synthase [Acidiferrobacterales bacterium]